MNKTDIRTLHSALVTMQRPHYKLPAAVLLQAAREAAKLEPQIVALDAAQLTVRNARQAKEAEITARFQAELDALNATTQAALDQLAAEEGKLEPFTLPAADITAAIATAPDLLDVIKPLLPYIAKAES